jgi:hypothetical protein
MMNKVFSFHGLRFTVRGSRFTVLILLTVLVLGWTAARSEPVREVPAPPPPPLFSPQSVMESGDYEGFFTRNSEVLKSCKDPDECSVALFNLIFVHTYSKSPYYNPRTALHYIHDLIAAVPNSQLAAQARVWEDLLQKYVRERARKGKRPATQEELARQESSEPPDEGRLEDQIRSKDEIIEKLNRQLERFRQIDIEMEQRERGLLR